MEAKTGRGGRREGSGRKVTPYKIPISVKVSQEAFEILQTKKNKTEYIDEIIRRCK